jgi:hypothetical protein
MHFKYEYYLIGFKYLIIYLYLNGWYFVDVGFVCIYDVFMLYAIFYMVGVIDGCWMFG